MLEIRLNSPLDSHPFRFHTVFIGFYKSKEYTFTCFNMIWLSKKSFTYIDPKTVKEQQLF